jgi:hypothetical protein
MIAAKHKEAGKDRKYAVWENVSRLPENELKVWSITAQSENMGAGDVQSTELVVITLPSSSPDPGKFNAQGTEL